ncbi:MAG: LysE family transporter [Myxococcaceae bacterium]
MGAHLFLLKAFAVGLVLAVPVGPMALLCIQRSLHFGFVTGIVTSLGIATADAIYGLVGILGLSVVADFLTQYETLLKLCGGSFLIFLAVRIILESNKIKKTGEMPASKGLWAAFVSAFILTLSNPMTVLAYVAVMAGIQVSAADFEHAWVFAAPVFLGSFVWWFFLTSMSSLLKSKLRDKHMHWIGMGSGSLLIVFALFVILSGL